MRIFKAFLSVILFLAILALISFSITKKTNAETGYRDYLSLAANASTVQKSYDFLEKALDYIEENGLTKGNTDIFTKGPLTDIGIWYEQIKGARDTLFEIIKKGDQSSQLEKDTALMRIKEILTYDGVDLIVPAGLDFYPFYGESFIFILIILLAFLIKILEKINK